MSATAKQDEDLLRGVGQLLEPRNSAIRYNAGTRIFEADAYGDFAYLIESGYVEISQFYDNSRHIVAVLGPGEIIGEMALVDGQPRSATATALHETTLMPISREQLLKEIWQASPTTRLVLFAAIDRLRTMYSKNENGNTQERSTPSYVDNAEIKSVQSYASQHLKLRFDLEKAVKNEDFSLVYQPIVCLSDGRTAGFEALVRWPQPDGGLCPPDQFIPLAEQSGLIVPLGAWIMKTALHAMAAIGGSSVQRQNDRAQIFMSINVSPKQLERTEDVEQLVSIIKGSTVNPSRLKIEITEQALLMDPRMATIALSRLKSTGVKLAIDDFGTGYSSLNYLHRFPLDTLKIDRSFIDGIVDDESRQRIVAAIITLAHDLGMDVVAEGIEERADALWLRSQSCEYVQGYLVSKPVAFADVVEYLKRDFEF